jgi:hypothetical protein
MDALTAVKRWIGELTDVMLMLLALAIVAAVLVGHQLPFFGNVTGNIMAFVKTLGDGGLAGLIALGIILWLFARRKLDAPAIHQNVQVADAGAEHGGHEAVVSNVRKTGRHRDAAPIAT